MNFVSSREYKIMLNHRWFTANEDALQDFWSEAAAVATRDAMAVKGKLKLDKQREITFFDTSDSALRRSGLVLRRRIDESGKLQFTVKARNADRYIANGYDLHAEPPIKGKLKLEEDIAPIFRSRFSHSNTVTFSRAAECPFSRTPRKLSDASRVFPVLGTQKRGTDKISHKTKLHSVNGITAYERVYSGPKILFPKSVRASVAIIIWNLGSTGRPLVAEFSFRYKNERENYPTAVVQQASRFFRELQSLDWCTPGSQTKTQYVYRE